MAFVEKRGTGRWRARYRGPDGRERSKTFDRKVDAERWLATTRADVVRGAWVDPALGRMRFEEWVNRWEAGLIDLRPTTRALNIGVARKHLIPRFGRWPLGQITTSDVKTMVADDLARGYSNSAVRRHVIVLRVILATAVVEGRIARNPCDGLKLPPEDARPMRFLEPIEVARLAEAFQPAHYRPLIYTAAYVGLRWGELAGLRVGRVDILRRPSASRSSSWKWAARSPLGLRRLAPAGDRNGPGSRHRHTRGTYSVACSEVFWVGFSDEHRRTHAPVKLSEAVAAGG
jgi:integrase